VNAMSRAVDAWRPDLVAALISGPIAPLPGSLDMMVGRTLQINGDEDSEHGRAIIEMLLRAGASGLQTERLFTRGIAEAVSRGQPGLLDTILKFRAPSGPFETVALTEAIRTERKDMLEALLNFGPSKSSLTAAVKQTTQLDDASLRFNVMGILINAGARDSCLSEALIQVVQWIIADQQFEDGPSTQLNMDLLALILESGDADVNYKQGYALQHAVKASCAKAVWHIISRQPSPDTLGVALTLAMDISNKKSKTILVDMLLRHRIADQILNEALIHSVLQGPDDL